MDEPSKVMPSSKAFSSSAGVMAKRLELAEDVGEPEPDEPDPALLDRPQHVVLLAFHGASFAGPDWPGIEPQWPSS